MKNKLYLQKTICLFLMICGMNGFSQFSGAFAPANWNFNTTTVPAGDGSVNTSGAPSSIVLSGSDNSSGGCCSQYEQYTTTIIGNGKISFDFSHVNPDIDDAQYVINGVVTNITSSGSGSLANILVNNGDVFSFRVTNYDNCCGRGVLTISNFIFTPYAGAALNFDGGNDYVSIGSVIPTNSSYTKEAWIYANASGSNNIISSNSSPFWIMGGQLSAMHNGGSVFQDPAAFPLNQWVHVAVTFNSSTSLLSLYKNGILVNSGFTNAGYPADAIGIGQYGTTGANFFQGAMDEIRIWNIARTQCDIISYMNCEIPTTATGLLANYHFNQGLDAANNSTVTTLVDDSGNSNTFALSNFALTGATSNWVAPGGVTTGSTTPSSCTPAAALNFDGVDDDVRATGFPNFTEYTIEGWFNLNSLVDQNLIVGTGNGNPNTWFTNQLQLNGGKFTHYLYDGAVQMVTSPITPVTGVWYHVAIVAKNGNPVSIYVNGIPSVSNSNVGSMSGANEYRMAGTANGILASFNGQMDEVRIWNVARSQCEINTYKNCEIPSTSTGLVANYHFNQGIDAFGNPTVATLTDASGNSNTGTLTNFALTGATSNWVAPGAVVSGYTTTLAPPTIAVNNGAICLGQSFTMTPSGAVTYTFSNGSAIATPTTNATYSVSGTDVNGCTSSVDALSSVTVNICTPAAALNFDGTDDYVQLLDPNFGTSDFTLETWMNPNATTGAYLISTRTNEFGAGGNWFVLSHASGKIGMELADAGLGYAYFETPTTPVTLGAWNHVALVRSGLQFSIYVNGVLSASYTDSGPRNFITGTNSIRLSGWADVGAAFFNGMMDETRFWNVARTQCEINTYKDCEIPSTTAGLIANYHFNQGFDAANNSTEINLMDASGNVNTGTLNNFALTGPTSNWIAPGGVVSGYTTTLAPTTLTVNSGAICIGQSFTMTPTGATTYTFSNGSAIATPTADATYSVSGTDANACISSTDAIASVTVNALPTISVNSGAICTGQSFTMTPTGATSYTFSNGSAIATPTANATYSVSGTDANGCISSTDAISSVTVNAQPMVMASTSSTLLCSGQTATLTVTGATSYTWSTTENTMNIAVTPTSTAVYTVTGVDANNCVNTTTVQQNVSLCTGIQSAVSNQQVLLSVYPNPTGAIVNVELEILNGSNASIQILNTLGEILINEILNTQHSAFNIQHFTSGVYFVKVIENNKQQVVKLIKQ